MYRIRPKPRPELGTYREPTGWVVALGMAWTAFAFAYVLDGLLNIGGQTVSSSAGTLFLDRQQN